MIVLLEKIRKCQINLHLLRIHIIMEDCINVNYKKKIIFLNIIYIYMLYIYFVFFSEYDYFIIIFFKKKKISNMSGFKE
jgi:hypothetical protein